MSEKYICSRCHAAGAKSMIPYKIIEDIKGEGIKFKGQLCDKCYKELFEKVESNSVESTESKS